MAGTQLSANPLKADPKISSDDPSGSAVRALLFVIGTGVFLFLVSLGAVVAQRLRSGFGSVSGVQAGDIEGGIR